MEVTMNNHNNRYASLGLPTALAGSWWTTTSRQAHRTVVVATVVCVLSLIFAVGASAGTYPASQCAPGVPAVSPGWAAFGASTNATTLLSNTCSAGGSIGDYVYTDGQPGAVTEDGESGSEVGLRVEVPSSVPGIAIHAIKAQVIASSVTGDDAFLEFSSDGQGLPGGVELPYNEGSPYTATDTWTLGQGARDFEAYVDCSTDRSATTCRFADASEVPALTNITLTLEDNTPPTLTSATGPLAEAAAAHATVAGSQPISFSAADGASGVQSATLTLSPLSGASPYTHTFSFSSECAYDAWNACPLTETVSGYTLNTDALTNGTYATSVSVTDAAGNVTNDALGSITINNPSTSVSTLGAQPGPGTTTTTTTTTGTAGAGSPNGTGASEAAHLTLGIPSALTRTYAKRALRVTGRLLNAQGLPITSASLDVFQQTNGAALELLGHASTSANGTFTADIPAGASRMVEIAYRAFSSDTGYAAAAKLQEAVRAGVQLRASPRRTGSNSPVKFSGRVFGPVPPQGVIVEILVHYRGVEEPIRFPRTNSSGRFHAAYTFQGGIGRFPFRALVFGSQADFPFTLGESKPVDVTTK
jgi:hypothetical protein